MLELRDMLWIESKIKSIADEIVNEAIACCEGEFNASQFYLENVKVEDLWGQKIRFGARLPQFYEDEGYSLYLTGMCDSSVDCDLAGYIIIRDKHDADEVASRFREFGCTAEKEEYPDHTYIHFRCSKITEKDLRNILDFVGDEVVEEWYEFLDELCGCEY